MTKKIEITINVIVHATEDISKIYEIFKEILGIDKEQFTVKETTGHFENPIILLKTQIVRQDARNFMKNILESLSESQINKLIEEIEERTIDSRFHMRLDKQELVKGNFVISEKDTIKIRIHTPIYNKKNLVKLFTEVFQDAY